MKVAVCLFARNEAKSILEWAAYNIAVGFDKIFIYDNNSIDETIDVLSALIHEGIISFIPWKITDVFSQYKAYNHCLKYSAVDFDWVAFIDADEFLVFQPGFNLKKLLSDRKNCNAIAIPWAIFGSSGHETRPKNLVTHSYTKRSSSSFWPNRHIKSIVRPAFTDRAINPHIFDVLGYELPDGTQPSWDQPGILSQDPDYSICQLNHYFIKSKEDWKEKINRGYRDTERKMEDFYIYDLNEVTDVGALSLDASVNYIMRASSHINMLPSALNPLSCLVDPIFYNIMNDDVLKSGMSATQHFWEYGLYENRNPNPYFDSAWYQKKYLVNDITSNDTTVVAPFLHYLSVGAKAGNLAYPSASRAHIP